MGDFFNKLRFCGYGLEVLMNAEQVFFHLWKKKSCYLHGIVGGPREKPSFVLLDVSFGHVDVTFTFGKQTIEELDKNGW